MNVSFMNAASAATLSNIGQFVTSSVAPWGRLILATSVTALTGLGLYRWSQPSSDPATTDPAFEKIKRKVSQTYSYVFGGWTLTGVVATAAHISGLSLRILGNSYLAIPTTLVMLGSLIATMVIDKDNVKAKHVAWGVFNATMGIMLSPLGFLGKKIIAQAAAISLGLGGVLTFIAYKAPDRRFLAWEGPLMAALSSITLASAIAVFFPGSAFAYGVDRVSLYGGLAIFSGLFMSSTQRLMEDTKKHSDKEFDPINSSLNIYLDGLNIFVRIAKILAENQGKEKFAQQLKK